MRRKRYIRLMARKHLNIGVKIQTRRKAMGLSQEDLAQLTGVSRQSVTKWETGQSAPDIDRLVELADVLGVSLDFLLREPPQTFSSPPSSVASSLSFPEDELSGGPAIPQENGPPLAGVSSPIQRFDASDSSPRLPEESLPEAGPIFSPEPSSLSCAVFSGQRSDLRPFLRRVVAACGAVLFMIGGLGLLALWALSEMHPVQLTDWDGSRHTGLWGFLLAHEVRSLFWLASGLLASGGVLVSGAWRAR